VRRGGFTLIELLVTIVLFSLLLMTALYSFRFVSINIRHINNTNPQTAINFNLLRDVIGSTYHYVVVDKIEQNIYKKFYYYFKGEKGECSFITMSPLYTEGLAMVHLRFKDSKLWYEEGKLFKKGVDYLNLDTIPMSNRFILLDNIENFEFSYNIGREKRDEVKRVIPDMVGLKMIIKSKQIQYYFKVKSDNHKNLSLIITRESEL
jgi:prepilin-type N-terminal cleavage/methylation domain-containing protein